MLTFNSSFIPIHTGGDHSGKRGQAQTYIPAAAERTLGLGREFQAEERTQAEPGSSTLWEAGPGPGRKMVPVVLTHREASRTIEGFTSPALGGGGEHSGMVECQEAEGDADSSVEP